MVTNRGSDAIPTVLYQWANYSGRQLLNFNISFFLLVVVEVCFVLKQKITIIIHGGIQFKVIFFCHKFGSNKKK